MTRRESSDPRNYTSMADRSIGKCSSGHWLPLKGDCDLCGAGPDEKCRYRAAGRAALEQEGSRTNER